MHTSKLELGNTSVLGTQREHPEKPCSMPTTNQILRNNFKEEWLNRWSAGTTGRVMYNHMPKPVKDDPLIIYLFRGLI